MNFERSRSVQSKYLNFKTIRFEGKASIEGMLIAQEYKKGLRSLLTKEESFALHEKVKNNNFY
jgi:hypothetical protein